MTRFVTTLALFLLPLVLFFAPPVLVLALSGEWYSVGTIEEMMSGKQSVVVGHAYSNFGPTFHTDQVARRAPRVITLGNSHVGAFRSYFFKDPSLFYNTTGAVQALSDYTHFIEHLTDTPDVIIANMEHTMFDPADTRNSVTRPDPYTAQSRFFYPLFESLFRNGGWWKVYADYISGKFTLQDVVSNQGQSTLLIGLRARTVGSGFTNDGSTYWGNMIHNPLTRETTLKAIRTLATTITDEYGGEYGNQVSDDALRELRIFLETARAKDIYVIGFLPPIAHAIYEELARYPDASYAKTFATLGSTLKKIYTDYNFDFYDFSNITTYGGTDAEMIEAKHGSEKLYVRLFIRMSEENPVLAPFTDLPTLRKSLANATSSYEVFDIKR